MESKKNDLIFDLPKKKWTVEFIVGLFVLFGILCFSYLSINLAGMRLFKTNIYTITAKFDNIAGLMVGAPVEVAGVKVGEVASIGLDDTSALVIMEINQNVQLRDDDIASVRTKGIIGEKYIKVIPGGSTDYLTSGSRLSDTESAVDLEEIIGKVIHKID
ncbi:MAG: outer membrane lipid asymmetry maintenance protein MlaD [Deltaproteobacteria bacterium]|jgi:phospholipid/cholesterol/gamma-HCH transport system substrate-binding protein|nr:outer membrane lipid asymmetry maintenance protein MlaD [Deltaproteobacteria bacterium]